MFFVRCYGNLDLTETREVYRGLYSLHNPRATDAPAVLLREETPKSVASIIARACPDTCLLSARLLAHESEFGKEYCALTAEVCHTYREECLKQPALEACRQSCDLALTCEQACQQVAV